MSSFICFLAGYLGLNGVKVWLLGDLNSGTWEIFIGCFCSFWQTHMPLSELVCLWLAFGLL